MKIYGWAAAAVWVLLGAAYAYQRGFAFGFVFFAYSLLCIYGIIAGWIGLRGVKATRIVYKDGGPAVPATFTAGDEAAVEVTLRRPFPLPLPWVAVRDRAGGWRHDRLCGPWLGDELKYRYLLPLPERGVYRFEHLELWTGDPFGIVTRKLRVPMPADEAVAAPKPFLFDAAAERALLPLSEEDRYGGVRPFRDGDPVKSIVWKTAARTGQWMVRSPEDHGTIRDAAVLVDATVSGRGDDSKALLDLCAEAAAGVCAALTRHRLSFGVWDGSARSRNASWAYRFAALEPYVGTSFADAARKSAAFGPETSIVIVSPSADGDAVVLCRDLRARGTHVVYIFVSLGTRASERERAALEWIARSGCRVVKLEKSGGVYVETDRVDRTSSF
ncbi:DUF58 domain-containing protein [Paenibacillus alkalitolerans]|uniref:DUF58 domain-containing protein n=1 Tax=Paenibacillus alkalitolerans TaxID=2799335 RepID=UPI0018F45DEC|nr:DUF58 domain-containing protein [Paenibacillus alkalitolerans]